MIFLLDVILLINLYIAFKKFKFVLSPPVLLGSGMLLAAFFSTLYYYRWNMGDMLFESAVILGVGPLLFTLVCCFFYREYRFVYTPDLIINKRSVKRLYVILIVFILLGLFCTIQKYSIFVSTYGEDVSFSRLQFLMRTEGSEVAVPSRIKLMLSFCGMLSYFSCWYLSYLIAKKKDFYLLKILLTIQIATVVLVGFTEGDKAHLFDPIARFLVIYIFTQCSIRSSYKLSKSFKIKTIVFFLIVILSLESVNLLLGRYSGGNSTDMLAQYCGAGIKNFDIFMHNPEKFIRPTIFGASTFHYLYADLGIPIVDLMSFNWINGYELGNVYTQYFSFYKDCGFTGVLLFTILTSYISMLLYNKAVNSLFVKGRLGLCVFLYTLICLPIFMSFFSSNITARVFRIGFFRNIIIFYIFISLFDRYVIKNDIKLKQT